MAQKNNQAIEMHLTKLSQVHKPKNFKLYIWLSNFLQAVGFLLAAVYFSFKHLQ